MWIIDDTFALWLSQGRKSTEKLNSHFYILLLAGTLNP